MITLMLSYLPQTPSPNNIILRIRFQTMNSGGREHKYSVHNRDPCTIWPFTSLKCTGESLCLVHYTRADIIIRLTVSSPLLYSLDQKQVTGSICSKGVDTRVQLIDGLRILPSTGEKVQRWLEVPRYCRTERDRMSTPCELKVNMASWVSA